MKIVNRVRVMKCEQMVCIENEYYNATMTVPNRPKKLWDERCHIVQCKKVYISKGSAF